ncbi:hypothetical protein GWI33_015329 [Rhynchophorus ferrugineus]|uniref:ER-bound oxygenase mpaB/mpaB'/Rubber oxygenase catalytic domain-containing protein n=1 Tax=Rhynchophorus ferrugineus TaxID=354439 RepID=A0A834I3K1_RHYFE|nr:hypothetical protein GWI33_015329 [Rhynchophorus ferrugineus]
MTDYKKKAEIFVQRLLDEGASKNCDAESEVFERQNELPQFYDEKLFKMGQAFYHKNIFAFTGAKLLGLMTVLSIPTIVKILIHTGMSGSDFSAYKRYVATVIHMTIWYDDDFKPGSQLWKSVRNVRNLHNFASNRCCKAGIHGISQKDMALTQFGFVGYQLVRGHFLGVQTASDSEWQAYLHLWRVIGYILGIEDRFNICSGTVEETKAICNELIHKVFLPQVRRKDPEFINMSRHLINGLWAFQPMLNFNVSYCSLLMVLENNLNIIHNKQEEYKKLTWLETFMLFFTAFVFKSLKWAPFRWYHNQTRYRDMWLIKNFPFLAYYQFGYKHSIVNIFSE